MNRVETRRHLLAVLPGFLFCILVFVAFLIASFLLYVWMAPDAVVLQLASNLVALLAGGTFIHDYIAWQCFVVIVTRQRIVVRQGIIFRRSCSHDLASAVVDCNQNLIDGWMDKGDLVVRSPHNSSVTRIDGLADFSAIRRIFEN